MGSLYKRTFTTADGTIRERPTWWLKYYQNGRAIRESTGTTKETVARRMLRLREGDVERGIPVNPKLGRLTFEEAAADIQNEYQVNGRRSIGELERRIRLHLKPVFGARRMAAITTADVRTFIRGRQEHRASNAEINRELAVLKRMYSLAVQGQKLRHRPYIPMLQENNVRTGFFEAEQFTALLSHLPAELQPVMQFAYITGWRIASEVLTLEWRQVDFTAGTVRLDPGTTKNRDGRLFPLTHDLQTLLDAQRGHAEAVSRQRGAIATRVPSSGSADQGLPWGVGEGPHGGGLPRADPLLRRAALVVEPDDRAARKDHVGHNEPDAREQLTPVVLHLGDNPSGRGPTLRLVAKALVAHQGLAAWPSWRTKEDVFDFQLQALIPRHADGIVHVALLERLVDRRPGERRVPPGTPRAAPLPAVGQSPA